MNSKEEIRRNIQKIQSELNGRATLLAATKTVPAEMINYAADCGIRVIGENRVDELLEKYDRIDRERLEIHFIGHLQRNKVKKIIDKVSMIHSVGTVELAEEIEKQASRIGKVMPVLIEINLAGEATKTGISLEETESFYETLEKMPHLAVCGLMAVPPKTDSPQNNQCFFTKIYQKFIDISLKKVDNKKWKFLSIGMSRDYLQAVENGATIVRIGSAIFGDRPTAEIKL